METINQKTLTIAQCAWSDDAARLLAGTLRNVPCYTAEDYRREVEAGGDTKLYSATDEAGATVGYVVLRVERYAGGAEGVLLAAAGKLAGASLYLQVLPALEKMFTGVQSFRIDACRSAVVKKLLSAGYLPTHFVMRKAAQNMPARTLEENLHALAQVDNLGGPHLCAGPGGRPHKGGSSSSVSSQSVANTDRRQVVDSGSVGVSSDSSTVTVNTLDGGAIWGAQQVANNALTQMSYAAYDSQALAAIAIKAASDLVGSKDQQSGRTVADALDFSSRTFDTANEQVQRANSDAIAFARDMGQGALDQVRMGNSDALAFADRAAERSGDQTWRTFSDALAFSQNVFETGIGVLDKAGQQINAQTDLVAKAYDNAKGEGTQKNMVAAAALAAVALVAISVYGGKK